NRDAVRRARFATEDAGRAETSVFHKERCLAVAPQQPQLVADAETAAETACSARSLAQGIAFKKQWIALLEDLDGLAFGDADGRAAVGETVAVPPAAVTAAREIIHDVVLARFGVISAEAEIAARAGRSGKQPVGN